MISDQELDQEIIQAKILYEKVTSCGAPKSVQLQSGRTLEFLEELKKWRETGKKILKSFKGIV